jgi:hypothetical protein
VDRARLAAVALALAAACTARDGGGPATGVGLGRRIATGEVRALAASPDGASVAWLDGCREAARQYLPPRTANCDLRVAAPSGGDAARVAGAVTTLPQGFAWAPEGATLAALADYDYANGSGTLVVWRGGKAREAARGVTFHGFLPGAPGTVGAVAAGALVIDGPDAARTVPVDGLATFEIDPSRGRAPGGTDAVAGLLRTRVTAGSALLGLVPSLDGTVPVAQGVADYGWAPEGSRYAFVGLGGGAGRLFLGRGRSHAAIGEGVQQFAFSGDGSAIAWLGEVEPGKQGNLHVAPVGAPRPAAAPIAREVGELRWATAAPRLAWLEGYDPRVRAGTLGVGGPDLRPRTFARSVTDFGLSPDGRHAAFLQHTTRGGYSVDLGLAHLDAPAGAKPAAVAQGVFGFDFSPDGKWLYYRTRCARNGEACDLERIPAEGLAPGAKPEEIAKGVKSFEFDPRDPARLLLGFQRMDMPALDVAVWSGGALVRVDEAAVPGTARFLGPDSRRLVYAVMQAKRAGVYVADLPR